MKSELIVDVQPGEVSIALLEDSRLVSLQKEARNIAYAVGDIYIAKVKKLMPGLNAAFVNVGYEKDAFLHYLDLGPHFASYKEFMTQLMDDRKRVPSLSRLDILPDIDKHGTIADQIQPGQELMVQIVKEPISSKGPRLTTEIAFTGRYMVLMPFSDKVSVSQKIKTTEEKLRLRQLINSIKPKNFGVIIRTSAEGKRVAELINEMKALLKCWEDACAKAQRLPVPSLIFEEESRIVGMLRDVFSPSFESIHVNDADIAEQIRNYVSIIAPERKDIVKTYTKAEPIFDTFSVTRQIKSSFGKTVSFKSGAYIIIEHTEALHVIDVNSGNRTKAGSDQESNALEVNLRAADEIARQLRLRDMGGIIVVDFIDMAKNEHRQQLYEHMKELMANDRARHNILPLSKFGLMQITRQRVRPALDITVEESCPSCFGHGKVQPSLLFTDTLYDKLEYVCSTLGLSGFVMYVHPFVDAYLKKGWIWSMAAKWKRQLGHGFRIIPDQSLAYLEYRVIDKDGNVLDLKDEKDSEKSSQLKANVKAEKRGLELEEEPEKPAKNSKKTKPAESGDEPVAAQETVGTSRRARQRQRAKAAREAAMRQYDEAGNKLPESGERPELELFAPVQPEPSEAEIKADTEQTPEAITEKPKAAKRTRRTKAKTVDTDSPDAGESKPDEASQPEEPEKKPKARKRREPKNTKPVSLDASPDDNAGTDAAPASADVPQE